MDWRKHIEVDPNVCHGKACIRGTRVMVSVLLHSLAERMTPQKVADTYRVTVDDVYAAVAYAADIAADRVLKLPDAA